MSSYLLTIERLEGLSTSKNILRRHVLKDSKLQNSYQLVTYVTILYYIGQGQNVTHILIK